MRTLNKHKYIYIYIYTHTHKYIYSIYIILLLKLLLLYYYLEHRTHFPETKNKPRFIKKWTVTVFFCGFRWYFNSFFLLSFFSAYSKIPPPEVNICHKRQFTVFGGSRRHRRKKSLRTTSTNEIVYVRKTLGCSLISRHYILP